MLDRLSARHLQGNREDCSVRGSCRKCFRSSALNSPLCGGTLMAATSQETLGEKKVHKKSAIKVRGTTHMAACLMRGVIKTVKHLESVPGIVRS
jgi:hypothetical protein